AAVNELGCDVMSALRLPDLVNGDDVRMIERRGGLGFLDKAAHAIFVLCELGGQEFECDFTVEPVVFGEVNFAHPARAQRSNDFVSTKLCASAERHFLTSAVQLRI